MCEWNIPKEYLNQQKEIERLSDYKELYEHERECRKVDLQEIKRLRSALDRIISEVELPTSIERVAREALRDD